MPTVESLVELLEADVLGVLPEALSAQVQVVLSDEAMTVGAGTAETRNGIWMDGVMSESCEMLVT